MCACVCVCVRVWRGGLVAWWFGGVVAWWRALEPDKATLYGDRIVVALGRGGSDALQTVGDTLHRPVRADGLVLHLPIRVFESAVFFLRETKLA